MNDDKTKPTMNKPKETTTMNETTSTPVPPATGTTPKENRSAKPHRPDKRVRRTPVLVLALVGVLLAAAHVPLCVDPAPDVFKPRVLPDGTVIPPAEPDSDPEPDHSAEIRRYNDAVSAALDRHLRRIGDLAAAFEAGLREKGPRRFDGVRSAIPRIRDSFDGFRPMAAVVWDGAKDKVLGGDRLGTRFDKALDGPFVQPCARAGAGLIADFETFQAQLEAETEAFREELGAAHGKQPDAVKADFPLDTFQRGMDRAFADLRRMPLHAGAVAGAAAIETATIRSTAASAKRLALWFGAKAIGKAAVSAGAPVADGPLPIGDAVAVGFAIWTARDIYKLQDVLPGEIAKSLTAAVDGMQARTIDSVSDAAKKAHAAYAAAARDLARAARTETTVVASR